MTLNDGLINNTYTIVDLEDVKNKNHLVNLGMYEGADVCLKSKGLGSLIVCIDGSRYGIGNEVAKSIRVEKRS